MFKIPDELEHVIQYYIGIHIKNKHNYEDSKVETYKKLMIITWKDVEEDIIPSMRESLLELETTYALKNVSIEQTEKVKDEDGVEQHNAIVDPPN